MRSFTFSLFLFALIVAPSRAQEAPAWKTELKDVQIPMRDGKSLAADVFLPKKEGKYPAILIQTPYNKTRAGAVTTDSGEAGRGSQSAYSQFDFQNYAIVIVDWRGFYASKDAMDGVNKRGFKRGQDGYDCVEWIAKQTWCDGKVGTWGGSALGKQQFDTAAEQPPHLVCAAPLIAYMGQRYDAYYEGGVMLEAHVNALDRLGFGVGRTVKEAPLPDSPIWKAIRNATYRPEKINVPCLLVSGWWDNYPDAVVENFNDLCSKGGEAARNHHKLIMGPWSHTQIDLAKQGDLNFKNAENYSTKLTLQFFDYWLREKKDNGWDKVARVHAYICGDEIWKKVDSVAALKTEAGTLYLDRAGTISATKPPTAGDGDPTPLVREYAYDPKDAPETLGGANLPPLAFGPKDHSALEKRKDLLVYSTGKLEMPLVMLGSAELEFSFMADAVDCDFSVRLCESDGKSSWLVAEGIQRAKLAGGKVELLKKGEKYRIKVKLNLCGNTFCAGNELKVLLSSGNSPRYERNCHTGADHWDARSAAPLKVKIFHNAEDAPVLRLPLLSK